MTAGFSIERGNAGDSMCMIVICCLRNIEPVVLVVLGIVDIGSEIGFKRGTDLFGWTISGGVVGCHGEVLDPEALTEVLGESLWTNCDPWLVSWTLGIL